MPRASLRVGGPAVVAQITCLANQGEALIVYELCGPVLEAVEGRLPGCMELPGVVDHRRMADLFFYQPRGWAGWRQAGSPARPITWKTVLPELPRASLWDGGPAVVAQLNGLAD